MKNMRNEYNDIANKLNDYIKQTNLKTSNQRAEILRIFYNSKKHLTAEEVYELCKTEIGNVGIATVYRALKLFCEVGICNEIIIDSGTTRYEINDLTNHHDHLICEKCGIFIEIHSEELEKLQIALAGQHSFILTGHRLNLYGICNKCRKK